MTPTLRGRRQTRLFLMGAIGVPVTLPFCVLGLLTAPVAGPIVAVAPLYVLAVVTVVGLVLDRTYDRMQQQRWDHDWPVHLQVVAGGVEGAIAFVVSFGCCGLGVLALPAMVLFPVHYGLVWGLALLFVQGPIRVLFPQWRYRGGELLG